MTTTAAEIVFGDTNSNWSKDAMSNKLYIMNIQSYLNHLLQARGHVFLNEVFDMIGAPRTRFGQTNGWVSLPTNPGIVFQVQPLEGNALRITFVVHGEILDELKDE